MDTMTRSPLARTVAETATDIWNDSCAVDELEYAIANGATGATANPTIVHDVWKADPGYWRDRGRILALQNPTAPQGDLARAVGAAMSVRGARALAAVLARRGGRE